MTYMVTPSPFDQMAGTYDAVFTQSHIGRLQRQRVWASLRALLRSYSRSLKILEINCGTGEDAWRLAGLGHQVTATDASPAMIEIARQKGGLPRTDKMQPAFFTCAFSGLGAYFREERFDLVVSNFGGLNCAPAHELAELGRELSSLLTPGGRLFLVVMSDLCLWEILYFAFKAKFRTAFRRQQRRTLYQVNDQTIPVYYYSPRKLTKNFSPLFTASGVYPVGLFIPPSYLENAFLPHRNWLKKMEKWENRWAHPLFSRLADHYCIMLEKANP